MPKISAPFAKFKLRCKNKLMSAGILEQAAALTGKLGAVIKKFNPHMLKVF